MKVALAQTNIIWEDKQYNIDHSLEMIKQATKKQADLILFPEMSFTGFTMNTELSAETDMETVEHFKTIAKDVDIAVGIGWVKKYDQKAQNHYTVIGSNGDILSDYVKIHPFSYAGEDNYFKGGTDIVKFEYGGFKWSTLICYDLRFPEVFQAVSIDADIIAVPANWPRRREEHWKTLLKARAIENQCYIFGINCVGNIGGIDYSGYTCGISPNGDIIGSICDEEKVIYIEINKNVQEIRNQFPVKNDRNWKLYQNLYGDLM